MLKIILTIANWIFWLAFLELSIHINHPTDMIAFLSGIGIGMIAMTVTIIIHEWEHIS